MWKKFRRGFAKSFSLENSFGKTESAFEFRQFLPLRRNPPEAQSPIPKKEISRKTNLGWEAMGMRADTEQQKRRDTAPQCLGADAGLWRNSYQSVQLHFTSPRARGVRIHYLTLF